MDLRAFLFLFLLSAANHKDTHGFIVTSLGFPGSRKKPAAYRELQHRGVSSSSNNVDSCKHDYLFKATNSENDIALANRRHMLQNLLLSGICVLGIPFVTIHDANAAPPIAVIAEELGYFPVTNKDGKTSYIPARAQRESSDQAIALAKKLSKEGVTMYGAYWCPHCKRQKELFGKEAWKYINYVECAPKGYGANPSLCQKKNLDGYPTWIFKDKSMLGGERDLVVLAEKVNAPFNPDIEQNVPRPLDSSSCK